MRPTRILHMYSARLTLFTRANCGLCDVAKSRLAEIQKARTVEYQEIDVMADGNKEWKEAYQYDVPVLHVEKVFHTYSKPNIITDPKKLWHRFTVEEINQAVDEAEQGAD